MVAWLVGSRLWDSVTDWGASHIRGLQALSRIFSSHGRGNRLCPSCDITDFDGELLDHLLEQHLQMDANSIIDDLHLINLDFLHMFQNNFAVVIFVMLMYLLLHEPFDLFFFDLYNYN